MHIERVSGLVYRQSIAHRRTVIGTPAAHRTWHDTVLVRVDTDDGMTGWGEAFGHFGVAATTLCALDTVVAPRCVGLELADPAALTDMLAQVLHPLGGCGPVAYALSGLDIALWDLRGKALGVPVHQLLGGARTRELAAYASLIRYASTTVVAAESGEAIERGYAGVKLHEIGVDVMRAALEVTADVPLMVDANCPWSPSEASGIVRQLEAAPVHWLEEPLWPPENHRAMAALRQRTRIPLAAGENALSEADFGRMVAIGAVDFAQPSVTKIGGLTVARRLAAQAAAHGVAMAPHSPYFGPGLLATLHLCAALAPDALVEHLFYDLADGPFGAAVLPQRGRFAVPQLPGLGADPDPARLAACRVAAA